MPQEQRCEVYYILISFNTYIYVAIQYVPTWHKTEVKNSSNYLSLLCVNLSLFKLPEQTWDEV